MDLDDHYLITRAGWSNRAVIYRQIWLLIAVLSKSSFEEDLSTFFQCLGAVIKWKSLSGDHDYTINNGFTIPTPYYTIREFFKFFKVSLGDDY